ncbi:MAG: hypothetical protein NZ108_07115 [Bacteroidia bacterium]|nr:hypothetical protein [Bacteroidia bacterium]
MPDIATKLDRLYQIESELSQIIHKDRKNWFRAAKLLIRIEKERLYELKTNSFTQYVKKLAIENNINVSTLWRAKSAATFYAKLIGVDDIEQISEKSVRTTPEQLEYFARARTIVPTQIVSALQERMLRGENIRNELHQLWETYRPLKHGKTERGRKKGYSVVNEAEKKLSLEQHMQYFLPTEESYRENNLLINQKIFHFVLQDQQKLQKYDATKEELVRTNILNALRSNRWICLTLKKSKITYFQVFNDVEILIQQKLKRLDVVAIAQKQEEDLVPFLLGVTVRTNIDSIQYDHVLQETSRFYHCHYVAIPDSSVLIEKAKAIFPPSLGILSVTALTDFIRHQVKIVRFPAFTVPHATDLNMLLVSLLKKSLRWQK